MNSFFYRIHEYVFSVIRYLFKMFISIYKYIFVQTSVNKIITGVIILTTYFVLIAYLPIISIVNLLNVN